MFTENVVEAMKFNEDPSKYLNEYLNKLKREKSGLRDIESRESMLPYAPFICSSCGKLFVKDQAIVQQGMCDCCHGSIIANASALEFEDPKNEEKVECLSCGEQVSFEDFENNDNTCYSCNSKRFVKSSLLEKVIENTIDINLSKGMPIVDAWKETGGKIYAHYQYELEDESDENKKIINFVACASGQFTKQDFVYFDWNDGNPVSRVYTMKKEEAFPIPNIKCACAWAFDSGEEESPEYVDSRQKLIHKGDGIQYVMKTGPVSGTISDINQNGVVVSLSKHPDYGHNLSSKGYSIVLTQDDIIKHNASIS